MLNLVTQHAARGTFNLLMDHEKMPRLLLLLRGAALYFLPFNQPRLKIAAYHVIIGALFYIYTTIFDNTEFKTRGAVCDLMWAYTFFLTVSGGASNYRSSDGAQNEQGSWEQTQHAEGSAADEQTVPSKHSRVSIFSFLVICIRNWIRRKLVPPCLILFFPGGGRSLLKSTSI